MQKKAALIVFRRPDCESENFLEINVVSTSMRDKIARCYQLGVLMIYASDAVFFLSARCR
jgi:hypothetical protein